MNSANKTLVKAKNIVKQERVIIDANTKNFTYLTIKDKYEVLYNKAENKWSCTCEHGSIWRFKIKPETCSHIIASMIKVNT